MSGLAELNIVILCVLLVIMRHIPNIKRLIKGEESKLTFKRNKGQEEPEEPEEQEKPEEPEAPEG